MSSLPVTPLSKLGDAMRRYGGVIRGIQWFIILFYLVLLTIPAFLSLPPDKARALNNISLFAQFVFWGIWWPFVLVSMVLFGRAWCGIFCPEGALAEWASKHGKNKGVPNWLKWNGWPAIAFALTTLYGQMISVYDYAKPALLILGGSTVAAVGIGLLYGRNKRVWCRYLCPVSGVFSLLARLAPVHFKVDEKRWQENPQPHLPVPNCAPLIDIRRMHGASACHACGRCSGQRDAVRLSIRSVNEEVVDYGQEESNPWLIHLLLYGILGLAIGAFTWTVSPWFIYAKQTIAEWLVMHDIFWPLNQNTPWWLFTHYPENNDAFNWVDGFCVVAYIVGHGIGLGAVFSLIMHLASKIANKGKTFYTHICLALIPIGGVGLFLGLTATTVKLVRQNGFAITWVQDMRLLLLVGALVWSLVLAWKVLNRQQVFGFKRLAVLICFSSICAFVLYNWYLMFWGWSDARLIKASTIQLASHIALFILAFIIVKLIISKLLTKNPSSKQTSLH
ncbi:4Fe-4S binding protein [Entomomonas asaccharolytica]|uniref:4Fe-4S binding protein n=1 Tax=Entomomonas asaccharolytica TaxID=2785331 RepID=A0A974NH37_9GAMM|nr:4Fe-4S binding protein [Entomomonas asaccharolytica]QQP86252.1 4Fe-4S binding protein [Entomomonas asaccharolytica]